MSGYITNGVLSGLHYHKAGQYRSLERVTCISLVLLIVVIITCLIRMGDGVVIPDEVDRINYPPRFSGPLSGPASLSPHFVQGYLGKQRIVSDHGSIFIPPKLPESLRIPNSAVVFFLTMAPGVLEFNEPPGPLSLDPDFGLPDPPPLWRFTERGLPDGIVHNDINLIQPPHLVLASPVWPAHTWLVDDTAVVEGYLTFHAHGLLSFELLLESHPRLGLGAAVQTAIDQSICFPSVDNLGNRITVRCRYRCLFFHGAQSSVSVDGSITARIREN